MKKWNVYLIHHSYGYRLYRASGRKSLHYHYDFIRQAIEILDDIHNWKNDWLRWLCMAVHENHWQIEISTRWQMRS